MASGGYRIGAGRPRGSKDSTPRVMAKKGKSRKKLTLEEKKVMNKLSAAMEGRATGKAPTATDGKRDPLTYLLDTMNDDSLEPDVRFRAAVAAAPFVHPRAGEGKGKKEDKADRARAAGAGKFQAGAPPKLAVVGK